MKKNTNAPDITARVAVLHRAIELGVEVRITTGDVIVYAQPAAVVGRNVVLRVRGGRTETRPIGDITTVDLLGQPGIPRGITQPLKVRA